jgi:hypothetical protein
MKINYIVLVIYTENDKVEKAIKIEGGSKQ